VPDRQHDHPAGTARRPLPLDVRAELLPVANVALLDLRHGGGGGGAMADRGRVHRGGAGAAGRPVLRQRRHRQRAAPRGRAAAPGGGDRPAARRLPRRLARRRGPDRVAGRRDDHQPRRRGAAGEGRRAAPARARRLRRPPAVSGRAQTRRHAARLRGDELARHLRPARPPARAVAAWSRAILDGLAEPAVACGASWRTACDRSRRDRSLRRPHRPRPRRWGDRDRAAGIRAE
jgi:hypothetical protein